MIRVLGLFLFLWLLCPAAFATGDNWWNNPMGSASMSEPYLTSTATSGLDNERVVRSQNSFITITDSGTGYMDWNISGALLLTNGGTGGATAQAGMNNLADGVSGAAAADGDVLLRAGGQWTRLAKGANGTYIGVTAGVVGYSTPPGAGTVTSVAQSLTGLGFMGISGSPVTTSGTLALSASGAAGDLPYFSSLNTMGLLTVGGAGKLIRSTGTLPAYTTLTMPDTIASGTIFRASSANVLAATAYTIPSAVSTAGKVVLSDGTNLVMSTPTFPNASATSGKFIISDGTNWIASTPTHPNAAGTAGKILVSDGTNFVSSTPTFPNASASSGKFIRSDGTNWIASTPTLPTTAGTSGKHLQSDGTNYVETTATYPATAGAAGNFIKSDGTNFSSAALPVFYGFGGGGSAGATTKGAVTETTPLIIDSTTFTQTISTTYAPVTNTVINATSTMDFNGTTNVGAGFTGGATPNPPLGFSGGFSNAGGGGGGGGNAGAGGNGGNISGAAGVGGKATPFLRQPGSGGGYGATSAGGAGGGVIVACAVGAITIGGSGAVNAKGTAGVNDTAAGGKAGGGGAGGVVFLASQTSITQTGTGSCDGGAGGNGGASGTAYGGGGGGGGYYVRISPSNTGAGSITVNGGGGGTGNTAAGTAGSSGTAMAITATPSLPLMGSLLRNYRMLASLHRIHHPGTHLEISEKECIGSLAALDSKNSDEYDSLCHLYRFGESFSGAKVVRLPLRESERLEALRNAG